MNFEAIEATASFDLDGKITPIHFVLQGHAYQVDSTGRCWVDGRGMHFLVIVPIDQLFELLYQHEDHHWYARQLTAPAKFA